MSDGKAEKLYYEAPRGATAKPLKWWKRHYNNPEWAVLMGKLKEFKI